MNDNFLEELNKNKKTKKDIELLNGQVKEKELQRTRNWNNHLDAEVDQYLNNKFLEFSQIIKSTCLEASKKALYIQENNVNIIRGSIVIAERQYLSFGEDDYSKDFYLRCVIWTPMKLGLLSYYNKHYDSSSYSIEDDICYNTVYIYEKSAGEKIADRFINNRLCETARRKTEQCLASVVGKNIPSIELSKKWKSGKLDFTLKF